MVKIFEIIIEIIGWIRIVLSPTLLGIFFGFLIYYYFPNFGGIIVGGLVAVTGFIIGIVWATNKFKTSGTMHFLSRVDASPDLDNLTNADCSRKQVFNFNRKNYDDKNENS